MASTNKTAVAKAKKNMLTRFFIPSAKVTINFNKTKPNMLNAGPCYQYISVV
jgi:hypothetical protein